MTQRQAKLLFDANIAKPLVDEIKVILKWAEPDERAEVTHVFEFQKSLDLPRDGVWDEVWVPEAAKQEWSIIAGDRGAKGLKKGQKLPALCREFGIVHFILSRRVHHRKKFKKLLTILSVWHEILDRCQHADGGSRFAVEPASHLEFTSGRGKLIHRPAPPGEPPPKGMLFDR